jgi:hypothetical protein
MAKKQPMRWSRYGATCWAKFDWPCPQAGACRTSSKAGTRGLSPPVPPQAAAPKTTPGFVPVSALTDYQPTPARRPADLDGGRRKYGQPIRLVNARLQSRRPGALVGSRGSRRAAGASRRPGRPPSPGSGPGRRVATLSFFTVPSSRPSIRRGRSGRRGPCGLLGFSNCRRTVKL